MSVDEHSLGRAGARASCALESFLAEVIDEADGYCGWQPSPEQVADLERRVREAWSAWRRETLHRAA